MINKISNLPPHLHLSSFLRRELRKKTLENKTKDIARSTFSEGNVARRPSRIKNFEIKKRNH